MSVARDKKKSRLTRRYNAEYDSSLIVLYTFTDPLRILPLCYSSLSDFLSPLNT